MNRPPAIPPSAVPVYEASECPYYSAGQCSSCTLLSQPVGRRLSTKIENVHRIFSNSGISPEKIEDVVIPTQPWGSRHKVKMAVAGTLESPTIGISGLAISSQDLSSCPLMPHQLQSLMEGIKSVIRSASLAPYDLTTKRGELKGLIAMLNRAGSEGILRFVLRSSEAIPRIRKAVGLLHQQHPWLRVISCNIQPLHAAIPEGPDEVMLSSQVTIEDHYGGIPLAFAPQSFMQVTPEIAEALYRRVAAYASALSIDSALDLFCGVGGFSFAVASYVRRLTGVEISSRAIASASLTAQKAGLAHLTFTAGDVDTYLARVVTETPQLVIANPPRRGLSLSVKQWLLNARPRHFVYSSCNPETFCRDAQELAGAYGLTIAAPFDMFPLTSHIEVLGFFERR
jgi:23S rRNA (uracil747-C5)-methyltransferase